MFLVLLPLIQGIAALCTIWGFANASSTNSTIVAYGAGEVDPMEWINSYGSLAFGIGSWLVTHYVKKKFTSQLLLAVISDMQSPGNPFTTRNLGLAVCDWIEEKHGTDTTEMGRYYIQISHDLRKSFVDTPLPQIAIAPVSSTS